MSALCIISFIRFIMHIVPDPTFRASAMFAEVGALRENFEMGMGLESYQSVHVLHAGTIARDLDTQEKWKVPVGV